MSNFKKIITYKPYGYKNSYAVIFLENLPKMIKELDICANKKMLIVYDTHLPSKTVYRITELLRSNCRNIKLMHFNYGPKSLKKIVSIWEVMVDFVPEVIIGIGGGTVSDLVGFAASTYQRGIPHIIFPTTVLGMIDASLGGKTAIDFHGVKNCIGAVHYPKLVVNIMDTLETLPQDLFFCGFSEAVKAAVLFDKSFFIQLENYAKKHDFSCSNYELLKIMKKSAGLKMQNSEMPVSHKIKLLYGHAVGHALEILSDGKLNHGKAVSIGMTIEGAIACLFNIWNRDEWKRQTNLLKSLHMPVLVPEKFDIKLILEKMKLYKKLMTKDEYAFVLPNKIGQVASIQKDVFLSYINKNNFPKILNQSLLFIKKNL